MTHVVIRVNEKPLTLATPATVTSLLIQLAMPEGASAVAVNQTIVARSAWDSYELNEGDDIALFQAIAGG
uniref:sulfur carrier protein ThiS n=1 Tax=Thaumasiovibrio occultus TaxID=1891184 RepID=UPI000B353A07|nr:sulfur carrier protein ThiS [Thaumasiovibrio occultus]